MTKHFISFFCGVVVGFALFSPRSAGAEVLPAEGMAKVQNEDVVITALDLRDIEVKDAAKLIAQKSGLNIVVGDTVQGKVTVYLENIPARDALATVLSMTHFAFEENAGLIQVITAQDYEAKYGRPFSQRVVSKVFRLKGMKATAAAMLLEHLKDQFGKVVADDTSGTIYVEDTPSKLAEIEHYLQEVDLPVETKTFVLSYVEAESVALRIAPLLTLGVGTVRADKQSGKIFVTDTIDKIFVVEDFLKEIDLPRQPQVFELSYAKAEDMLGVIKPYLTPELGSVDINKHANQLIVVDTRAKLNELGEIIRQLDKKEKQVLIETRIVQVILRDEYKMGVDWDAVINKAHGLEIKTEWGGTGTTEKSSLAIGTLSDDNYRAVIEALGSLNRSHTLSNPRIAVINNEEAKILVGTTKPYVTSTTSTPTSGPVSISEDVKFIDVGVKLVVTPMIHEDGFVTMRIRPEVSSATTSIKTGQNNVIPIVDKSEVETTVRVKDGVTIVIGGLIKNENSNQESKVPLLGDVPILGHAFKNSGRSKEQTELVIFLTPRIISGDLK